MNATGAKAVALEASRRVTAPDEERSSPPGLELVPGSVKEGTRAVVSTFSVSVEDAGPDGVIDPSPDPLGLGCPPTCGSGDEAVYLRQGIFAP